MNNIKNVNNNNNMNKLYKLLPVTCILLAGSFLSSCSGVKESLGLTKEAPDEFAVVRHAPLEIPPTLTRADLPKPRPGMNRPQEKTPSEQAREALIGDKDGKTGLYSNRTSQAENILLEKANAAQDDPSIRRKVDEESYKLKDRNTPVIKKLTGLSSNNEHVSATVVDPKAEYERIKKNIKEGKPVTEGQTPYIDE